MELKQGITRAAENLSLLGVNRKYCGRKLILFAVELALEDEDRMSAVMKEIYSVAGEQCGYGSGAVERDIRTVVSRAWSKNPDYLRQLAGYPLEGPPTASEFLDILVTDALRHAEKSEKE